MKSLLFLLCLSIASIVTAADSTITMTGSAKASAAPDVGYISVGVATENGVAGTALKENTESMNKLFALLKEKGIEDRCLQTSNFSIQPKYVHVQNEEQKFVGYTVSNILTVTVHDLSRMGNLIDAVVANGVNRVNGISFGNLDKKPLLDKARLDAVKDAQAKANLIAESLNVKLGAVISVQEYTNDSQPRYARYAGLESANVDGPGTSIAGGELSYSAQVTIVWHIKQFN